MRLIDMDDVLSIVDDLRDQMTVEGYCAMVERVKAVPSVQPEKRTETHACDLIERQAAIDEAYSIVIDGEKYDVVQVETLMGLPSAQPERDKGEWIYGEDKYGIDGYHCDKCGFFVPWDYAHTFINYIKDYNFCPNCGARMEDTNESD